MNEFNFDLPSFKEFAEQKEKITNKIDELETQIELTKQTIEEQKQEYSNLFLEGKDTSKVSTLINANRQTLDGLQFELNELAGVTDTVNRELGKQIIEEYKAAEKEARKHLNDNFNQFKDLVVELQELIEVLNKDSEQFVHNFNTKTVGQVSTILHDLNSDMGLGHVSRSQSTGGVLTGVNLPKLPYELSVYITQ